MAKGCALSGRGQPTAASSLSRRPSPGERTGEAASTQVAAFPRFPSLCAAPCCSVSWSQRGSYLSVGTDKGEVQIWDAAKTKRIRTMPGHKQRVGCTAW